MNNVIFFSENSLSQKTKTIENVGIRGAELLEMASQQLPVAPGFIFPVKTLGDFNLEAIRNGCRSGIGNIKSATIKRINSEIPLLLKVVLSPCIQIESRRSIHNIGLNDQIVETFANLTGEDFAYGEYKFLMEEVSCRFLEKDREDFFRLVEDLDLKTNKDICLAYRKHLLPDFPQDAYQQLELIIDKITKEYFKDPLNKEIDTALVVQMMVNGNLGENSYNGSFFSRDTDTGENKLKGYFGENIFWTTPAEGKDIKLIPEKYLRKFKEIALTLEEYYFDIREIKFIIEEGKIWLLEQKSAEASTATRAELRTLLDLKKRGLISTDVMINRVSPGQLVELLHPVIDQVEATKTVCVQGGIAGSPGAAAGRVFFSTEKLINSHKDAQRYGIDTDCILIMRATYAEDVKAIEVGQGVITTEGGYASHAPVVARSLGKPAMVNNQIEIFDEYCLINGNKVSEGDYLTIEVSPQGSPKIYFGKQPVISPDTKENGLQEFLNHINRINSTFQVYANADTVKDAELALEFGAKGIGLCRTEHMFFEKDRINIFREMIAASSPRERKEALNKLKPFQKADFTKLFETMKGLPVTVRLLDAPLNEFLPKTPEAISSFYDHCKNNNLKITNEEIMTRFDRLNEVNPMLGHRGCRIGISYPEIYEMQVEALLEAAYEVKEQKRIEVQPEIMIPLVMSLEELEFIKNGKHIQEKKIKGIQGIKKETLKKFSVEKLPFDYKIGTMIELPAAALSADKIALQAEFFSFGTNDLTQTTNGLSRDDINNFLPYYTKYDIFKENPFQVLDESVKTLIQLATRSGRMIRPDLKTGLCGEHGQNVKNITFCIENGIDYVSCSPYGIPLALLAVAQYNLANSY